MRSFLQAFRAELTKQQRSSFTGKAVFFSLFLWPVLMFFSTYYSLKPFGDGADSPMARILPDGNVLLFLATGYAVFQLYWSVVQSAWTFEQERKNGTLEMVFLAPGSRMAFLLGRSVYAIFNGVWMFTVFAVCISVFAWQRASLPVGHLVLAILLTLLCAAAWGAFLSAVCLFSRDSGFLYYMFQEPMQLFGSVSVPSSVFPLWGKICSYVFPVTFSLYLVRGALAGETGAQWWMYAAGLPAATAVLLIGAGLLVRRAENYARRTGSWTLF
jgi:ABC-2 type transport system permease protein